VRGYSSTATAMCMFFSNRGTIRPVLARFGASASSTSANGSRVAFPLALRQAAGPLTPPGTPHRLIYQVTLWLDRTGPADLLNCAHVQDWFLRYELRETYPIMLQRSRRSRYGFSSTKSVP